MPDRYHMTLHARQTVEEHPEPQIETSSLERFVLFLGHQRSGTTLMANLLDAHPSVAIAFQHDAVGAIAEGAKQDELFRSLLQNSARHAMLDELPNGYGYKIPGQWQGRVETLRVIGDKKAAGATHRLSSTARQLDSSTARQLDSSTARHDT